MDLYAFTMIMIAGISTGLGATPIYFKREYSTNFLDLGLGFSAGVMLIAAFSALIFPSVNLVNFIYKSQFGIFVPILGLIIGYQAVIYLHKHIPHEHLLQKINLDSLKNSKYYLIFIAMCLHNIPEGLSVGIGFGGTSFANALYIGIAISIQNLPEGLVVALGVVKAGESRNKAFLLAFLSGIIEPIAAFIGFYATTISKLTLHFALAFAGGAMLFVVCQEMLPELFNKKDISSSQKGILLGFIIMILIINFI